MDKIIKARFIIEILGRPAEYVKKNLIQLVDQIDEEKGVEVTEKIIHDVKEVTPAPTGVPSAPTGVPSEEGEEGEDGEEGKPEGEDKKENKPEKTEKVFTTFAEIDAEFETMEALLLITFKYMPSNIEITSPENFMLKNDYFSEILTGIILRLHRYDEISKKLVTDRAILAQRLEQLMKEKGIEIPSGKPTKNPPKKTKK